MEGTETETIGSLFEKHGSESQKFDRIAVADRLHPDRKLCGFLYIASLMTEPGHFWLRISASHDELCLPGPDDLKSSVTEADVIYLQRCGIHWNSEYGCFYTFT